MKVSRKSSPLQIMIETTKCIITNDARCTREIKSKIVLGKAAFNRKKTPSTSRLDLIFKEETCEMLLYGAEIWTHRKVGRKYLESFEMWC
jgi:hypothetical protein